MQTQKTSTALIGVHAQRENFQIQAHDHLGFTEATEDYVKGAVQYIQNKINRFFVCFSNNRYDMHICRVFIF